MNLLGVSVVQMSVAIAFMIALRDARIYGGACGIKASDLIDSSTIGWRSCMRAYGLGRFCKQVWYLDFSTRVAVARFGSKKNKKTLFGIAQAVSHLASPLTLRHFLFPSDLSFPLCCILYTQHRRAVLIFVSW